MSVAMTSASSGAARAAGLRYADTKASQLFDIIERDLIRPGVSEKELSKCIHDEAARLYDVRSHWHRITVRSGPNTLCAYEENPPDRLIEEDDIVIVDLGPVFKGWEADFGRTYVLGDDGGKIKLRDALEPMWHEIKAFYEQNNDITGEDLYRHACERVQRDGWAFGSSIAGHIIGPFPHERLPQDPKRLYIADGNSHEMRTVGGDGLQRHWILEVHLRDPNGRYGGFFEQLLTA